MNNISKYKHFIKIAVLFFSFAAIATALFYRLISFAFILFKIKSSPDLSFTLPIYTFLFIIYALILLCFLLKKNFRLEKLFERPLKIKEIYFYVFFCVSVFTGCLLGSQFTKTVLYSKNITPEIEFISNISNFKFNILSHIGTGLIIMLSVLLLVCAAVKIVKSFKFEYKVNKGLFFVTVIAVNLLTIYYIENTNTVFFWDTAGFWATASSLSGLVSTPKVFIREIIGSLYWDYTHLGIVPIALIFKLIAPTRLVFILFINNIYLLPAIYLFLLFISNVTQKNNKNIFLVLLLLPLAVYLATIGFIDVGGIFVIFLIYLLSLKNRECFLTSFFIGVLLILLFLFRRWYLFWCVSYITVDFLFALFANKKHKKILLSNSFAKAASFGFILFFFLQPVLLDKLLLANYGSMYAAYMDNLNADLLMFDWHFGFISFVLFALALLVLFFNKKYIKLILTILTQSVVCFLLFRTTQAHGQQHLLLYLPGIMVIFALAISVNEGIIKKITDLSLSLVGAFVCLSLMIGSYKFDFLPSIGQFSVLSKINLIPEKRSDLLGIFEINNKLFSLTKDSNKTAAILSSSMPFNEDTFRLAEASNGILNVGKNYLASIPQVDARDGFPYTLLWVDYIVVLTPAQTHLNPDYQRVITIPWEFFEQNRGFANAFTRLDFSVELTHGVTAYIYEKVRDITYEEERELKDAFKKYYPDFVD